MKLTLKLKLLPTDEQADLLLQTMREANSACDEISARAWECKTFAQFKLHKEVYHQVRKDFRLSSQMIVRCISKVADAYKLDKKTLRTFRPLGSIAYDSRILSYNLANQVASVDIGRSSKNAFRLLQSRLPSLHSGGSRLVFYQGQVLSAANH